MSGATLHASCVLVGEAGVLIRGPSGSGKSTLARQLIDACLRDNRYARLVGDDRITVHAMGGRLIARPVAAIAGLLEVRGIGLLPEPHEAAARLALVVDCLDQNPPRLPDGSATTVVIRGVSLRLLALKVDVGSTDIVLKSLASCAMPDLRAGA